MSIAKELSKLQKYGVEEELVSPYLAAKAEWDERIGSARVQAYNWRIYALGSIVLNIILGIGLIYQSSKATVIPYVVRVNSDGIAQTVGTPEQITYVPKEAEIKYFLTQFVQKIRSLSLDPVVSKQNWVSAYASLTRSAAQKMNKYIGEDNPALKLGKQTIQVGVSVIVPISKDTYQIRWQEQVFDKDGASIETYKMTGIFSIIVLQPTNQKELLANPLGLYIKDFSYNKEF